MAGARSPRRGPVAVLAGAFPPAVLGWREVFVPLAVVVHSQHGLVLATAALAVAAGRAGEWFHARTGVARPGNQAALVAGLALLLLGFVPEEGPLGLLLWIVFGLAWPALRETVAGLGRTPAAVLAWLLLGMVLAGPLALGPGTWPVAAGCFFLAWRLRAWRGDGQAPDPSPPERSQPEPTPGNPRLGFLFGLSVLTWIWLMPAWLVAAGLPVAWCGAVFAGAWLLRGVAARYAEGLVAGPAAGSWLLALAALAAALSVLGQIWATSPWQMGLLLALHGLLLGLVAGHPSLVRPETLAPLPAAQALGELVGPVAGAVLLLLGSTTGVFAGGAVAALVLGGALAIAGPVETS